MENGWIKLYRSLGDHEILGDHKALAVFMLLLMKADKTGRGSIGRFTDSARVKMKPITFYKVLSRLQKKYDLVTLNSNNKYTSFSLLNWAKYQSSTSRVTQSSNNKVTTKEQQSNTLQEYKNKEIRINTNTETIHFIEKFNQLFGTNYTVTAGRIDKLKARLNHYTQDQIIKALVNLSRSSFHRGNNDRKWTADPDFLIRSDEMVDKWLNASTPSRKTLKIPEYLRDIPDTN